MNILKVVQVSHHQGDIRYGATSGIQCSYMSLMSICCSHFKSPVYWDSNNLNSILGKGDNLLKSINRFCFLGTEDLSHEIVVENHTVCVEMLQLDISDITMNAYLLSISEIVRSCQQIIKGASLIINNYVLGII